MATSTNVHNQNILSPLGFEFILQRTPNLVWTIQEVTLPGVTLGDSSIYYSGGRTSIPGDKLEYSELEISFIVDESLNNWREIYNWMRGLAPSHLGDDTNNQYATLKATDDKIVSDATLVLLTNSGNPNIIVEFKDVFPLSISNVPMKITDSSVEPVVSTVLFQYSYMNFRVVESVNDTYVPGNTL